MFKEISFLESWRNFTGSKLYPGLLQELHRHLVCLEWPSGVAAWRGGELCPAALSGSAKRNFSENLQGSLLIPSNLH